MALTFPTTSLKKPSGVTAIPSGFKRPAFGTLYGFDAQGGADDTSFDTEANIRASTGAVVGQVAFGTDTYDLYVFDGSHWHRFEND